ncbi:MAG: hypothetical protein JXA96_00285 [Sedimentisphaerales bacterium]|nr:hypothetical protein [Sedimentisphaerales bacterium]
MEEERSGKKNNYILMVIRPLIVVIVILAIPMFLMSIVAYNHQLPPRLICGTNMSGLGKAMMIYVNDFDGYPTPEKWCDLLIEYCDVTPKSFRCKGAKEGPCNFAINKYLAEIGEANDPDIVVLFETQHGWNQVGGPEMLILDNHNGEGSNVVFLDTHTEFIKAEDISKLKWKPEE